MLILGPQKVAKIGGVLGPQKVAKIGGAVIELNNHGNRQFLTFE
jgi:hypothetical protein